MMHSSDQDAHRYADAFRRVIVLDPLAGFIDAVALTEDNDEPRRSFQKRFVLVGAQMCERA